MAAISELDSMAHTTLVVGVDGSEFAEHVLRVARGLVRVAERAEVHVVTVVRPQPVAPDVIHALPGFGPTQDALIEAGRELVRDLCKRALDGMGAKISLHVRVGRPAEEIEQLAIEVDADVIVIEAHGRTGLARMFHKSVAAELARNAPCSVLTVRTKHGIDAHMAKSEGAHPANVRSDAEPTASVR